MPDLSQKIDFIVQTQNTFDIVFKHGFVYCFQGKLSLVCTIGHFIYSRKVSFSYNVSYIILASKILEYAEILQQLEPFLDQALFL